MVNLFLKRTNKQNVVLLLFLFFSFLGFSQTTVTLQDQCNCEVLSGTDVTTPGAISPTGADIGDIYVNTDSGTIFYWDGDSWELISGSDSDTLVQDFTLIDTDADTINDTLRLTDTDGGQWDVLISDLAGLINTDDQTASEVSIADAGGNFTATDVEGALSELAAGSTDDQALSLAAGNILTLEDGGTVDLTPFLDNTDDQAITAFSLDNGTNELTLTLEDGGTQTVDFTTVLAAAGTDDQALSLAAGNILTLEDGGTVDLTPFLDNTDDQAITAFSLDNGTNELTLTLEDGGTQTVDFTTVLAAAGTDDQTASEVS
ncbi:hypothetical protein, partial [Croceivirga lutea]|uniref:hypothetical protein n=1 Tax=Croceivirga lutea TaxID=1775167 RepID=UPI0019D6847D